MKGIANKQDHHFCYMTIQQQQQCKCCSMMNKLKIINNRSFITSSPVTVVITITGIAKLGDSACNHPLKASPTRRIAIFGIEAYNSSSNANAAAQ